MPLNSGVLSFVGVVPASVGAAGAAVSTTSERPSLVPLVLPALSSAVAVIVKLPSEKAALGVKL